MATCSWKKCLTMTVWYFTLWFGAIPTLITAAGALGGLEGQLHCGVINVTSPLVIPVKGVAGFLIGISSITIIMLQFYRVPEMLRACNIKALDRHLTVFYAKVLFVNFILMLGFLAGGAAATYYAVQLEVGNSIGNTLTSAAVFSYLGGILELVSVVITTLALVFGWRDRDVESNVGSTVESEPFNVE